MTRIDGKKIFLRYINLDDEAEALTMFRESRRLYRSVMTAPEDSEEFAKYVRRNEDEANRCFVVCRKNDGRIVGIINLTQIFRRAFQNAYLGYALGVKYTGNGYMTDAVETVVKYAFADLKLHRLEANVQPGNTPSLNILRRAGFTKEGFSRRYLKIGGRWRDHERWAIIAEDWAARRKTL